MKKYITLFLLTTIVHLSCKEKKVSASDLSLAQMQTVLEIHDELMDAPMKKIVKLVGELKPKVDSTQIGLEYNSAMKDLQKSHESMMHWMQGFGKRFDSDEILNGKELSPQKKEWLNEEEEKVKALREQINASIERAEKLLNK